MTPRLLLLLSCVLLFSTPMSAAAAEPPPLSLPDALLRAAKSNPSLIANLEAVHQARANRDKAFALIQPTVRAGTAYRINDREISFDPSEAFGGESTDLFTSIYGNFGVIYESLWDGGLLDADDCAQIASANGFADCAELTEALASGEGLGTSDEPDSEAGGPVVIQPKEQLFVTAEVNWPISPRVVSLARAGNQQVKAAREQTRAQRDLLLATVIQTYARALHAQEAGELLETQVRRAEAHLADTELLLEEGVVTRDAVLRARAQKARSDLQLVDLSNQLGSSRRNLALLMGSTEIDFGSLEPLPGIEVPNHSPEEWTRLALVGRPELAGAEARAAAARELEIDSILQFLPALSLTANWNWSDTSSGFDSNQSSWSVGIGASLPIWDGGLLVHSAREAASRKRQARKTAEATLQQVTMEVLDAHGAWSTAELAVPVAELEHSLAEEAFRLVDARYRAGEGTQVEVLDAVAALQNAELNLLLKKIEAKVATAALLSAGGSLQAWLDGLQPDGS